MGFSARQREATRECSREAARNAAREPRGREAARCGMGCNDLGAYGMVAKNAAPALRLLFLLAGLELAGLPAIRSINSWLLIFFCMAGFDLWQLHGVAD